VGCEASRSNSFQNTERDGCPAHMVKAASGGGDAAVILLNAIVEVPARPMPHMFAEHDSDRPRIGVETVSRHPVWRHTGDRLCRSKERPGRTQIAMLAEHYVDQDAITIDGSV
jgi:hypothetical protein